MAHSTVSHQVHLHQFEWILVDSSVGELGVDLLDWRHQSARSGYCAVLMVAAWEGY